MKRILCFGDSNTWGYVPGSGERYAEDVRWTGVAQQLLGPEYRIIEDGINGRTTVWENPYLTCRSGIEGIGYSLLSARPLDLVVVMLGTNDLVYTNCFGYSQGLPQIVRRILYAEGFFQDTSKIFTGSPQVLLVSPVRLHPDIDKIKPDAPIGARYADSCRFVEWTEQVAREYHVPWVDAAAVAGSSEVDGLHLTPEGHRAIGQLVAAKIREIL